MVELHCHLQGVLGPDIVRTLIRRGVDPGVDPGALEARMPIRGWDQWTTEYSPLLVPALEPVERLIPVMQIHLESLIAQGVTYVELMAGGLLDPEADPGAVLERLRVFRSAADAAAGGRIEVTLLAPLHRRRDPAHTTRLGDQLERAAREGLLGGIAICARETAGPISDPEWQKLLPRVREAGLGVEIHAGELGGPESVRDALDYGRPDRLGHAVRAFEDERLVAEIRERDIHIEFCPTSNLRLGVVPSIQAHPIARARELGMNFSFNTDDPGPFACSMASERDLLAGAFGFREADFEVIRRNALRSRFA
jgi:adenosine deaminase